MWDRHETDLVPSPGGWDTPPNETREAPERMPRWVRVWRRIPFLDRSARRWMWSHGGYLVLPPDHPLLGRYSPAEYEALTGISKAQYERQCVDFAREAFAEEGHRFVDVDVALERNGDGTDLVVHFAVVDGPGRRFGARYALWPSPHPDDHEGGPDWTELLPTFVTNDLARRDRVGRQPDADGVTWL